MESIYIVTVFLTVFLMINRLVIPNIVVLSSMLGILLILSKGKVVYPRTISILMLFVILLLIQILLEPSQYFSKLMAMKDIQRFIIYAVVILVVANCRIRQKTFIMIWGIVFAATFLIAFFQFSKIININNLLEQFYGESGLLRSSMYTSLEQFRGGSVFVNSNSYAKFVLMYLAIILGLQSGVSSKRKIGFFFSLAVISFSLILSGSRTGFVIAILLLIGFVSHKVRKTKVSHLSLIIIVSFSLLAVSLILAHAYDGTLRLSNLRLTRVRYGIYDSLAYKFGVFNFMISEFEITNFFLGLGRADTIWGITMLDFDIGYLISFYGLVGATLYLLLLLDFWNFRKFNAGGYKLMNRMLVVVLVLFGLTGGLFFNLRIFTVLSTILFADVVKADEMWKRQENSEVGTSKHRALIIKQ
ncbi:MAG: hypothetical protein GYA51_07950 [Candidatus Methanofastidiosa archaeon]|nr:hypothetical protein [Candidatus Methanofastidiosa archaeon]